MSFNAIRENKTIAKISESTVSKSYVMVHLSKQSRTVILSNKDRKCDLALNSTSK